MSRFYRLFLSMILLISVFISFEPAYANSEIDNTNEISSTNTDNINNQTFELASDNSTNNSNEKLQGFALKQPVHVYERTSRDSKVLKSYNYNHRLTYYP